MTEFKIQKSKGKIDSGRSRMAGGIKPLKLSEIKTSVAGRISSGIEELDRVLGGGFISGEVVLLAGEPGIGKSTLLLELGRLGRLGEIIYVSGEESPEQIKVRAER